MINCSVDKPDDLNWQNSLAAVIGNEISFTLSSKFGLKRSYSISKDLTQEQTIEFMLEVFKRYSDELRATIAQNIYKAINE